MHIVVGKPIEVKKNPQPTQEEVFILNSWSYLKILVPFIECVGFDSWLFYQVLELQSIFISSLKELYERHKMDVGYEAIPLYIH
jgi:hypothetical protein